MTTAQVVLVILVVLVAAGAAAAWYYLRQRNLKQRFGPEYDRAVAGGDSRRAAERELRQREKRHDQLDLRPLSAEDRQRYAEQWQAVQEQFVEDPAGAVVSGDKLMTQLVAARGYPTQDHDEQMDVLSVDHARTLGHYRDAHEIFLRAQRNETSTEQLRQALVHYREIFADVLGESPMQSTDDRRMMNRSDAHRSHYADDQRSTGVPDGRPDTPAGRPDRVDEQQSDFGDGQHSTQVDDQATRRR